MKCFLKGATLAFLIFFLTFVLDGYVAGKTYENFTRMGWVPLFFFFVYTICFMTEILIQALEWKFSSQRADWVVFLIAFLISVPFLSSLLAVLAIMLGALSYYLGRRLPDHWTVYTATPIPVLLLYLSCTLY